MPFVSSQHTGRFPTRRQALGECFTIPRMEAAWKKYVRDGMRHQDVPDLHDYYDFHRDRRERFATLQAAILEGRYKPSIPVIVRIEKKLGLTRRICIPDVGDAVILQTLTDYLHPRVRSRQPSENAFFSRSHGFTPPEISAEMGDYGWFIRWKKYSKKRLVLPSEFSFIAISDISNYYENIDYGVLRNVLSSVFLCEEVLLDFLFMMLEGLSWRPDYLPTSNRGLPQVNFDAPRLLAHAFLFEIDEYLKEKTQDRFVRWVDDITIPTNGTSQAAEFIHGVDELLMTRGLRLNSGKTATLPAKRAAEYLQRDENNFLDLFESRIKRIKRGGGDLAIEAARLQERFDAFEQKERFGYWDKILKRYLSVFGYLGDPHLERKFNDFFTEIPALREALLKYYSRLGASKQRFEDIKRVLLNRHIIDDVVVLKAAEVPISWRIDAEDQMVAEIRALAREFGRERLVQRSEMFFLAGLRMLAKYGDEDSVQAHILLSKDTWTVSSYLARQVAAVTPKLSRSNVIQEIRGAMLQSGQLEAVRVLEHLDFLRSVEQLPMGVEWYLGPPRRREGSYPLHKFLILLQVLRSVTLSGGARERLKAQVRHQICDPIYERQLDALWGGGAAQRRKRARRVAAEAVVSV